MNFDHRVAIVTGSTNGIGETVADKLFSHGAKVIIASKSGLLAKQKAQQLSPDGHRATGIECDVSDPEQVRLLVEQTINRYGRLDFAVNNAGKTGDSHTRIPDQTLENWQSVLATSLSSVFYCMKYELPAMQKSGGGAIVNLSAVNGLVAIAGLAPYTVAKHGVIGLTKTAALEYAEQHIRVNAVAPGYVATPRVNQLPPDVLHTFAQTHPMSRLATREEVADLILFLLSDKASFCTGGVYTVDGGYLSR
ncbi:SDR family NAD(P)-dependent oxidoreductase [Vibrio salinus]|uniref:SDR family NAD(P)-dependent oxidoreductase n=1 Tax=Vibrio salinus TaxID=2899784 RepID=UPI001E637547|nr:SDR family NAD(P)-dependent oxidoreductase [Vibrio salinus]MCE0494166.1 SDR family oxidoreductase [Vibrio salinus]